MNGSVVYLFTPMTENRSDWPNRVREQRQAKGLTLEKMSELTGISHPMLAFIERGKRDPKLSMLQRIALVLELEVADLLARTDHSYAPSQDERFLVDRYRQLDAQGRRAVRGVAETLTSYTAAESAEAPETPRKSA